MGKSYRTSRPIPADLNRNPERKCKESTVRRFSKALKKFTHHRERRRTASFIQSLRTATMGRRYERQGTRLPPLRLHLFQAVRESSFGNFVLLGGAGPLLRLSHPSGTRPLSAGPKEPQPRKEII